MSALPNPLILKEPFVSWAVTFGYYSNIAEAGVIDSVFGIARVL
jgi:hypothetical protein